MNEGVFTLVAAREETGVEVRERAPAAAAVGEVAASVDSVQALPALPALLEDRGVEGREGLEPSDLAIASRTVAFSIYCEG
uniref:Uncharacterized protein n=1 Tax=Pristionchus pacificus TaxID=54126 RepID=A0A2A6BKU3_PRIPA|eukprot:PDM66458.1 hypothetical protein PRIPAC_47875 [Pristionchus pacificus]